MLYFFVSSQKWSSLRCLTDTDLLYPLQEVSEDPLLPFEFTKRAVEQLGEQLQDICDKEFASILHTGLYFNISPFEYNMYKVKIGFNSILPQQLVVKSSSNQEVSQWTKVLLKIYIFLSPDKDPAVDISKV